MAWSSIVFRIQGNWYYEGYYGYFHYQVGW
jgi:hypothetical protein